MFERIDPVDAGFAVYVHWPFCASKCPYCDFNSHVRHQAPDEARFLAAYKREIAWAAQQSGKREVRSIFFGGGTPSLMKVETVAGILAAIHDAWPVSKDVEITLEANPTSVEAERFKGYRAAGVNRLSIGVQSLIDADLKALGRLHSAAEALAAIKVARSIFDRYSFDLIYARSGQGVAGWRDELTRAIGEAAEHLSLYMLTIEQGTPFFALHQAGKLVVPDEELSRAFYDATQEICDKHGLPAYEISNHAKKGAECQHNLVYWRCGSWAGIGPGAHGRLDTAQGRLATANEKNPEHWLGFVEGDGHGVVLGEKLLRSEQADEFLVMGLRLTEGIDCSRFAALSGRGFDQGRIDDLLEHKMIEVLANGRIRVTPEGLPVLDAVVADLAAEEL